MRIKWLKDVEFGEANFFAAGSHLISAAMALCALLSSEWILIEGGESGSNSTQSNDISNDLSYQLSGSIDECTNIGCYDFWRSARFGGFRDKFDQPHVLFHSNDRVLLDCVTPVVANLFYILIALCFFMFMSSVVGCVMNIIPPAHGFLQWVRANSVAESANMILTLCTCITGFIAELEISSLRPDSDVAIGMGILFITISGCLSFIAAISTVRQAAILNRMRRLENQRIICSRSLRSWRDVATRRPEDSLPIVDFERYLDCPEAQELGNMQQPKAISGHM